MLCILEHLAVYITVAATMWWQVYAHPGRAFSVIAVALSTALLVGLLVLDTQSLLHAVRERREAIAAARAITESERLRRRAYELCASLRLAFDICEDCWAWHPDRAASELDRMRSAVGQFLATDIGASG